MQESFRLGGPLKPTSRRATPAPASTHRVAPNPEGKGPCLRPGGLDAPRPASASRGGVPASVTSKPSCWARARGRSGTGTSGARRAWIEGSRPRAGAGEGEFGKA